MILVTGGTGLVGSHLLLELARSGKQVRAIHRSHSDLRGTRKVFSHGNTEVEAVALLQKIEWITADITDIPSLEKAFSGVTRVYHCAALVSFDPAKQKLLRKINIEGTANIVNLCIRKKIEKICLVSSIATFDRKIGEKRISEASSWNKEKDHSVYAITKYGAEMEVWRASQEGVPVVIVNPGVIIGPGFWNRGSGLIFKKVDHHLKFHFPKTTGFTGVWDVVKVMREMMEGEISGEQVIVVAENKSFKSVFGLIAKALNKPVPWVGLKPWMVGLAWVWEKIYCKITGKERKLTRITASSLFSSSCYSNEKARSLLQIEFEDIETVIERTGAQYLLEEREKIS